MDEWRSIMTERDTGTESVRLRKWKKKEEETDFVRGKGEFDVEC